MADDPIASGEVWLVGAGPGDPELLTRKAERLIRGATIVFHDALVGQGVLDLIPPGVPRVSVGKRSGRHTRDQAQINALLVSAARAGARVVRLKGGDPALFGRAAEEKDALARHGIPCRICPGVTAASAAAAHAGISLSLRGLAREVRFITAHARAGDRLDLDWASLASARATLAFYMGRAAAPEITRNLLLHGLPPGTPVLIASNVSHADEQLLGTRLDLLPIAVMSAPPDAPSLLLIGPAVAGAAGSGAPLIVAATPPPSPSDRHAATGRIGPDLLHTVRYGNCGSQRQAPRVRR